MEILTQSSQSLKKSFTEKDYNSLSEKVIRCCMEVHKELGPGLMESVYEICAVNVMKKAGLNVQRQVVLPVVYKGETLGKEFLIDILVNDLIILELKSVETVLPVHEAQLVTYLKLADKKLGLLINFNVTLLKDGIKRKINGQLNSV
jgi:GxxExxY protein